MLKFVVFFLGHCGFIILFGALDNPMRVSGWATFHFFQWNLFQRLIPNEAVKWATARQSKRRFRHAPRRRRCARRVSTCGAAVSRGARTRKLQPPSARESWSTPPATRLPCAGLDRSSPPSGPMCWPKCPDTSTSGTRSARASRRPSSRCVQRAVFF